MKYLIVGYGNIGHKRQAVLGSRCVATYDPISKAGADYKNLAQIPDKIYDAAVLTVPQKPKYKLLLYFLSRGKHVLVEKPLIITRPRGKILSKLAKKNGVIWYTSYNHRFEPNIVKITKLLDQNKIGRLYHARFVYSFGNIKERIGTWRETKFGVLEEIAPHLLDLAISWFGYKGIDFKTLISRKIESDIIDHWVFNTDDQKIIFETSAVTWKNIFSIDIYGKLGSIHLTGLNKWGGSRLIVRKRVLPSGVPKEKISNTSPPDITWKKDFQNFEQMVKFKKTSLISDLEVSEALASIKKGGLSE